MNAARDLAPLSCATEPAARTEPTTPAITSRAVPAAKDARRRFEAEPALTMTRDDRWSTSGLPNIQQRKQPRRTLLLVSAHKVETLRTRPFGRVPLRRLGGM